jgi:hypothetical protein
LERSTLENTGLIGIIMDMKNRHTKKGQALVELGVMASLMILAIGTMATYIAKLNSDQYIQMESFRRALKKAHDTNKSIGYGMYDDRRMVDSGTPIIGQKNAHSGAGFVHWSVPSVLEGSGGGAPGGGGIPGGGGVVPPGGGGVPMAPTANFIPSGPGAFVGQSFAPAPLPTNWSNLMPDIGSLPGSSTAATITSSSTPAQGACGGLKNCQSKTGGESAETELYVAINSPPAMMGMREYKAESGGVAASYLTFSVENVTANTSGHSTSSVRSAGVGEFMQYEIGDQKVFQSRGYGDSRALGASN